MQKDDFIRRVLGLPWADRACTFDAVDCWGLVVLYYRHVLGIEIHQTPGYEAGKDFLTCFDGDVVFWHPSPGRDGDIAVFYRGDEPAHIGVIVGGGKCLHSRGESGNVRVDSILAINKLHTRMECLAYGTI
ncbi:C40 family peptidase [Serratia liquefaciens]|uniref:C40 family peptidase n=1 Tax=Serratia liquefaciens TaxID=614 RepID=UPI00217A00A8|nr:C40 family peptidase [Serratia liquefaciens]CAI1631127.1 NlpC/P60 family [Serratia liquefaciens]